MTIYVDTSAFMALVHDEDIRHTAAVEVWSKIIDRQDVVVTSLYVVVETVSLLHNRFGTQVAERFLSELMPLVQIVWSDVSMHNAAVTAMLAHPGKSGPSLVDCMSLEVIRQRRITGVFAYDHHFEDRGLNLLS